jgi:hypothetical protein
MAKKNAESRFNALDKQLNDVRTQLQVLIKK